MALRQLKTAETLFVSDTVADGVAYPPTADAVADDFSNLAQAVVFEKILMAANDKTYEVTIDAEGALAVAEVTEGD